MSSEKTKTSNLHRASAKAIKNVLTWICSNLAFQVLMKNIHAHHVWCSAHNSIIPKLLKLQFTWTFWGRMRPCTKMLMVSLFVLRQLFFICFYFNIAVIFLCRLSYSNSQHSARQKRLIISNLWTGVTFKSWPWNGFPTREAPRACSFRWRLAVRSALTPLPASAWLSSRQDHFPWNTEKRQKHVATFRNHWTEPIVFSDAAWSR